jgi:hypothetical protein
MLIEEFETRVRRLGEECSGYASEAERIFSHVRGTNLDALSVTRAGVAFSDQLKESYGRDTRTAGGGL